MATVPVAVNSSAQGNQEDSGEGGCCSIFICWQKSQRKNKAGKAQSKLGAKPLSGETKDTIPLSKPNQKSVQEDPSRQPTGDTRITDATKCPADTTATPERLKAIGGTNAIKSPIVDNVPTGSVPQAISPSQEPKSLTTPRLEAEQRYEEAVQNLRRIVEEIKPGSFNTIPDVVNSQDQPPTDKIKLGAGAKELEMAMATFIQGRREQEESRSAMSKFITKLYQTSFPVIKAGFKIITDTMPTPYAVVLNGLMAVLQIPFNLGEMGREIDEIVFWLFDALGPVKISEDWYKDLPPEELESYNCALLNISSSVTNCLATILECVVKVEKGIIESFSGNPNINKAKFAVQQALEGYNRSALLVFQAWFQYKEKRDKYEKVAEWVLAGSGTWEAWHKIYHDNRTPGTGDWFMTSDTINHWLKESLQLVVCHGDTGAGKSFLTSRLIDDLKSWRSKEICLTYFYFHYKGHGQTAEIVITSLLKQMLYQLRKLPADLEAAYNSWEDGRMNRPDGERFSDIFAECAKEFSIVFVVIEAFNECDEDEGEELLVYLNKFLASCPGVKLYITTRSHLKSSLLQSFNLKCEGTEISAHKEDIEKYVRKQLDSQKQLYSKAQKDQIVEKIQDNAKGMFLLAKFQAWYIIKNLTEPVLVNKNLPNLPTFQVKDDSVIAKGNLDAIRDLKLPQQPAEVYEIIMNELVERQTPLRILSWIFHARQPLRMEELLDALIVFEGDNELRQDLKVTPDFVVQACKSLVVYDKESGIVRFTHYSVQEFLSQDKYRQKFLSSTELAMVCLTYLKFEIFNEPCPDLDSLQVRLNKYQFLCYASQFWGYHTKGDAEQSPVIQKAIFETFRSESKLKLLIQINTFLDVNLGRCFKDPSNTNIEIFHVLASNGLTTLFKILLEEDVGLAANIEGVDERGWTALHFAAANGHLPLVQLLVNKANLEAKNEDGEMAIHLAAKNGHVEVLKELMDKVHVTTLDNSRFGPIHWASKNGHFEVVEELIKKEPSLLVQAGGMYGDKPIHLASDRGHLDIVKWLVKHEPKSISVTNYDKRTALHSAVAGNHLDVVNYLLEKHIDVSIISRRDGSARELARALDRWKMVECIPDRWESDLQPIIREPERRLEVPPPVRQVTIRIDSQTPELATFHQEFKRLDGSSMTWAVPPLVIDTTTMAFNSTRMEYREELKTSINTLAVPL